MFWTFLGCFSINELNLYNFESKTSKKSARYLMSHPTHDPKFNQIQHIR
jgi:hypothetical protein